MRFTGLILRMISLFNPLKIFMPTSIFLLIFGFLWSLRAYTMTKTISSMGTMIVLAGIMVFVFGLLADQIAATRLSIGRVNKTIKSNKN